DLDPLGNIGSFAHRLYLARKRDYAETSYCVPLRNRRSTNDGAPRRCPPRSRRAPVTRVRRLAARRLIALWATEGDQDARGLSQAASGRDQRGRGPRACPTTVSSQERS